MTICAAQERFCAGCAGSVGKKIAPERSFRAGKPVCRRDFYPAQRHSGTGGRGKGVC